MKSMIEYIPIQTMIDAGFNEFEPSVLLSVEDDCIDKLHIGHSAGNTKILLVERNRVNGNGYEYFFGVYFGKGPGETQSENDPEYKQFFEHVEGVIKTSKVEVHQLETLIRNEAEKAWEKYYRPVSDLYK